MLMRVLQSGFVVLALLGNRATVHAEMLPNRQPIRVNFGLGYTMPAGYLTGQVKGVVVHQPVTFQQLSADDVAPWLVAGWLDLGYRVADNIVLGVYLPVNVGATRDSGGRERGNIWCQDSGGCGVVNIRYGVQAQYLFAPDQDFSPWLTLGIGGETLFVNGFREEGTTGMSFGMTFQGWDYATLQLGAEWKTSASNALGIFLGASCGGFESFDLKYRPGKGAIDPLPVDMNTAGPSMHHWFTLGVIARFRS